MKKDVTYRLANLEENVPEPRKYIFTNHYVSDSDTFDIIEIGPILYGFDFSKRDSSSYTFFTQEEFTNVINFHRSIKNHCPFLRQEWLGRSIDIWETASDYILYDSEEAAIIAAGIYLNTEPQASS